jgi:hypothetical protein
MSDRNDGASILSFGHFQGYTNIKRVIRHSPRDLLATKSHATAAFTLPHSEAAANTRTSHQQQKLLAIARDPDPHEPQATTKPFACERARIQTAIDGQEVAYRLEQVISLHVGDMVPEERTFQAVINPLFQWVRFFLVEPEAYTHLFHSFPLTIFPGILTAFAWLFELALDGMALHFT